jgi:hypothetical protein
MNQFGELLASGDGKRTNYFQIGFQIVFTIVLIIWSIHSGVDGSILVGLIVFFIIVDILCLIFFGIRATSFIKVYENGIEGLAIRGIIGRREFSCTYDQVASVNLRSGRVTINTKNFEKYTCHANNAQQIRDKVQERVTA